MNYLDWVYKQTLGSVCRQILFNYSSLRSHRRHESERNDGQNFKIRRNVVWRSSELLRTNTKRATRSRFGPIVFLLRPHAEKRQVSVTKEFMRVPTFITDVFLKRMVVNEATLFSELNFLPLLQDLYFVWFAIS